ncbi:MAG: DUF3458 domain-containing protein, partial [Parachlamydiaceae bacterium]|nr:DUF3458 domain-containing protein [Parachlamydiaceae bacterium]
MDDYFEKNIGKAVTFEALLESGNKVLKPNGKDLTQFEKWFSHQGVPTVQVCYDQNVETGKFTLTLSQSNVHPETKEKQSPFAIPFSYELIGKEGKVYHPRTNIILEDEQQTIEIDAAGDDVIPVLMHGYSAPIILKCNYTLQQLESIALFSKDVYCKWKAGQDYAINAIKEVMDRQKNSSADYSDLVTFYKKALESENLSYIAKCQLLTLPSLEDLSQKLNCFDFELLNKGRGALLQGITKECKDNLCNLYYTLPKAEKYEPTQEQMGVRDLRNKCLQLLVAHDPQIFAVEAWTQYNANRQSQNSTSHNFTDAFAAFSALVENNTEFKEQAIKLFYEDWKKDKTVFNYWLTAQSSGKCSIEELEKLNLAYEKNDDLIWGFDERNPNHLRSIYRKFIENPLNFHRPDGKGYRFIVDAILKIGQFNPTVSHNSLCIGAIANFSNLPLHQQAIFAKELRRLLCDESPSQTREAVGKLLEN